NFTKAAEECNVAQPSLTRAVQKLEEELGGSLFHRERANTHLTELGRLMLPHLEQTYAASQAAKALATSVRKGEVVPFPPPETHRFAKLDAVPIGELNGEKIVDRIDCAVMAAFRALCAAAGIEPESRHKATSEDQLQRLVLAGFGCGISPRTIPLQRGLAGVPIKEQPLERSVMLGAVTGRRFSAATDAFIKVARSRD